MKLIFKGIVQGVGFRPTIYRTAKKLDLKGYVLNKGSEVEVVIDKDDTTTCHEEIIRQCPICGHVIIDNSKYGARVCMSIHLDMEHRGKLAIPFACMIVGTNK